MKKILFLICIILFTGYGCSNPQNETIEQQQRQIDELNKKIDDLGKQQSSQEQTIKKVTETKLQQQNTITVEDIKPYLTGINKIFCKEPSGWSFGSGILFGEAKNGFMLTNKHVITSNSCETFIDLEEETVDEKYYGAYKLSMTDIGFKNDLDVIMMKIGKEMVSSPPVEKLNYKITNLRKCPAKLPLNSPVAIVGFPITTQFQEGYETSARTITNGIVSAYKNQYVLGIQYSDYFVTAKIDSGNSGGAAFSKDEKGLCFMGIPTWVSLGDYETQGIVQNIQNILAK